MGFPFLFESNFETGTTTDEWDSETDVPGNLNIRDYKYLAARGYEPFSGAQCLELTMGSATTSTLLAGAIDIAASATRYVRFNMKFCNNFAFTANDVINIFEFQQAGGTVEACFGLDLTSATDDIKMGIGETAADDSSTTNSFTRDVWYTIELAATCDSGAGNDGTIDLYVTPFGQTAATGVAATQVASLDQGAIGRGFLGIKGSLTTTTGCILIDNLVAGDARIYPQSARYPETPLLTKSGHAFVGNGKIESIQLLSGGNDNVLKVFDTDVGDTTNESAVVCELGGTAANQTVEHEKAVHVSKGAYVNLAGTNPRALVKIAYAPHGAGAIRSLGARRA